MLSEVRLILDFCADTDIRKLNIWISIYLLMDSFIVILDWSSNICGHFKFNSSFIV